jgi:siroheme synthase (precorrin-2 oxidase/ferrochelatase)
MSDALTTPKQTTRLTVDLADDDYQMLKVAVATAGKGVTLSSVVRELIHDHLQSLQDDADRALVSARAGSSTVSGQDVRARFARRRLQAMR